MQREECISEMLERHTMKARTPRSPAPKRVRVVQVMWRLSRGGGVPIVVRHISDRLDPTVFDLHIVTLRPALVDDGLDELPPHVAVHTLGYRGRITLTRRLLALARVALIVRRLSPHIVQSHTGTAWLTVLARVLNPRAKFLLEVHDAPGRGRHGAATERFEGWLTRRARYTALCHSRSVRADVTAAWRTPEGRLELFPLGINTDEFGTEPYATSPERAEWCRRHRLPDHRPIVLYVARLVASKNVGMLIEVADRVSAATVDGAKPLFVVAAEGSMRAVLEADIDRRGLADTVRLIGALYGNDLVGAYHAAIAFCSTSDYEGFGLAIVEAMASGLPVVATAVGGVTDLVVDEETGALVRQGDAEAMAREVLAMLADPARSNQLGESGRTRALARFDARRMVEDFATLYLRLAGRADR